MIVNINKTTIRLLGDPHLGKRFVNGVPLHRRGERERMQRLAFLNSVNDEYADAHICMGDLFDSWSVPYTDLCFAIATYSNFAQAESYVLRGNHDAVRDADKKSAFDAFSLALPGLAVEQVRRVKVKDAILGLIPWHPFVTAEDLVRQNASELEYCHAVFGHWDVDGNSSNLIPTKALADLGIEQAYTGHVHQPCEIYRDGVNITVVGSMQPYAHGEGDMYVTLTAEEARGQDLKDKCVRIRLQPGEILDYDIDCLQLTVERQEDAVEDIHVTFGEFDVVTLFNDVFSELGVSPEMRDAVFAKYQEKRLAE